MCIVRDKHFSQLLKMIGTSLSPGFTFIMYQSQQTMLVIMKNGCLYTYCSDNCLMRSDICTLPIHTVCTHHLKWGCM